MSRKTRFNSFSKLALPRRPSLPLVCTASWPPNSYIRVTNWLGSTRQTAPFLKTSRCRSTPAPKLVSSALTAAVNPACCASWLAKTTATPARRANARVHRWLAGTRTAAGPSQRRAWQRDGRRCPHTRLAHALRRSNCNVGRPRRRLRQSWRTASRP